MEGKSKQVYQRAAMMEVLRYGSELTKQLQNDLQDSPKKSQETKEYLIDKILSCYEKAISMAFSSSTGINVGGGSHGSMFEDKKNYYFCGSPPPPPPAAVTQTATAADGSSSWSEISDQDQYPATHHVSKKRKKLPRWSKIIRVASGSVSGPEGPLDDGYSWRKYGQKNIHGANFPRAYYRCTHSKSQGCLATKQVQKSDEDPTIFHVVDLGNHTCSNIKQLPIRSLPYPQSQSQTLTPPPPNPEPSSVLLPPITEHHPQEQFPAQSLKVKTENLTDRDQEVAAADDHRQCIFRNFSFSSSGALLDNETMENYIFPDLLKENDLVTTLSAGPTFVSNSDSNHLWSSPCGFGESNHGAGFNGHISESSVTNSPVGDAAPHASGGYECELELYGIGIDLDFTIDSLFY